MLLVMLMMRLIFHLNDYWLIQMFQGFANDSSANIRLSKTKLQKIGQSG